MIFGRKKQVAQAKPMRPIGRRPVRSPRKMFWTTVAVCLWVGGLGVSRVWLRVSVLDKMYRLSQAQSEHDRLVNEREKLRLEEAALAATARVDRESQRSLGLRPAPAARTVVLTNAKKQLSAQVGSPPLAGNAL